MSWASVSYGLVNLELRTTKGVRREVVKNSLGDYLTTRWTFNISSIYNPAATTYRKHPADGDPLGAVGMLPTITDAALRHYLLQPRRTLIYKYGNDILLRTPAVGYTTDAQNGPIVEECNITQTTGVRTFLIEMKITCMVNECGQKDTIPILSHTWKRWVSHDQDYFATVTTEGTAVFRSDVMKKFNRFPDQYRRDLMHPVPDNFQRNLIVVVPEDDGVTVTYHTVDREMPFNIGQNAPFNRFEAYHTSGYSRVGEYEAAFAAQHKMIGSILGAAQGTVTNPMSVAGQAIGVGFSALSTSISKDAMMIPRFFSNVVVKAWGKRADSRFDMMLTAFGIALKRVGDAVDGDRQLGANATNTVTITHQLDGKYVEVNISRQWPWYQGGGLLGPISGVPLINASPGINNILSRMVINNFPRDDTITSVANVGGLAAPIIVITQDPHVRNPGGLVHVAGNGARGSFLGKLVAQALSEPCTLPPPTPTLVATRTPVTDLTAY